MAHIAGKFAEPVYHSCMGAVPPWQVRRQRALHYTVDVLYAKGDSGSREAWLHMYDKAR
jgi:hypothetical protein